jgi:hypothetical protein
MNADILMTPTGAGEAEPVLGTAKKRHLTDWIPCNLSQQSTDCKEFDRKTELEDLSLIQNLGQTAGIGGVGPMDQRDPTSLNTWDVPLRNRVQSPVGEVEG